MTDLDAALQALPESGSWGEQLAGLTSIFETYIEDPSQLERLRDMHCELGQGFYLGEPLDEASLAEVLRDGLPSPG